MPIERSQAEILSAHADAIKADIWSCRPATVTAVNVGAQTVDVQVAVNGVLFDELGTAVSVPAPSFTGVRLGVMRGGGFLIWVPVAVGDSVLLVFSDLSCDTWGASKGGGAVDPGFVGMHTADSPFAIPMIAPDNKALTSANADHVVIGKDGADEQILIGASDIVLGRGATEFVALADKVATELGKIANAFTSFIPGSGGASFALPYTVAGDVSATLVKAK